MVDDMELIKTIGNIKVFATKNTDNDYTINLYNGSDCIYSEVYLSNLDYAINHSLQIVCDIFSESDLANLQVVNKRLSGNTLMCECGDGTGKQDYFCRIDNTEYFKHYFRSVNEFIEDKNGMRIIDR